MKILWVVPESLGETFWTFSTVLRRYLGVREAFVPLGVLAASALLPREWPQCLVDMNVRPLRDIDLEWADVVFVSVMFLSQVSSAEEVIRRARALGKVVVVGGPVPTSEPEKFSRDGVSLVLGPAELSLGPFLEDLETDASLRPLYLPLQGASRYITESPIPNWGLLHAKLYGSACLQFSSGCPYQCEFCSIWKTHGLPQYKTPDQVKGELSALFEFGWRGSVFVVDDNAIGNKRAAFRVWQAVAEFQHEHGYPFRFTIQASVNLASNERLLDAMEKACVARVFLGFETTETNVLDTVQKGHNTKHDPDWVVGVLQRRSMDVAAGFIIGFDDEDPGVFDRIIKLIRTSGIPIAMVGILQALPHTDLWRRLEREGRLLPGSTTGNNVVLSTNFQTAMSPEVLSAGLRKILGTIYSWRVYYETLETFLERYKPSTVGGFRVGWRDIRAFAASLWYIGLRSPERFAYWRLLAETIWRDYRAIPRFVQLTIEFQHLRSITETICCEEK